MAKKQINKIEQKMKAVRYCFIIFEFTLCYSLFINDIKLSVLAITAIIFILTSTFLNLWETVIKETVKLKNLEDSFSNNFEELYAWKGLSDFYENTLNSIKVYCETKKDNAHPQCILNNVEDAFTDSIKGDI